MDSNAQVTTHTAWQRFIFVVVLTALIVGSLLLINQLRSTVPRTLWPESDIVTLTGYGRLSPTNPSSDPTSVVLNRSQALALDQEACDTSGRRNARLSREFRCIHACDRSSPRQCPELDSQGVGVPSAWDHLCRICDWHSDVSRIGLWSEFDGQRRPAEGQSHRYSGCLQAMLSVIPAECL